MPSYHEAFPWLREARTEADKWAKLLGTERWPTRAVIFALYGGPDGVDRISKRRDFERTGKLRRSVNRLIRSGWLSVGMKSSPDGIRVGVSNEVLEAEDPEEIVGWLRHSIAVASTDAESSRERKRLRALYPFDTFPLDLG